jgi:putative endonuclease
LTSTTARGRRCEERGEEYLIQKGYRVVTRNFRAQGGEIDRIAWDGEILCFIEIRSRSSTTWGRAVESVGPRKQARLIRTAQIYLTRFQDQPPSCRFDVLGIQRESEDLHFELIQDAFTA